MGLQVPSSKKYALDVQLLRLNSSEPIMTSIWESMKDFNDSCSVKDMDKSIFNETDSNHLYL